MKPCIVVAGMGRCGTSLMMQMLEAGGIPTIGDWPAYETDASMMDRFDAASFSGRCGQAIKLIDPANLGIGDMPNHVVIWMRRDHGQQAKSQIKMLVDMMGLPIPNRRSATKRFAHDLRGSEARHMAAVGIPGGCPAITLHFEELIASPVRAAQSITEFLAAHGWAADAGEMASQVTPRDAACYPGFLEVELISQRMRAA